jgi:hypothetical protein
MVKRSVGGGLATAIVVEAPSGDRGEARCLASTLRAATARSCTTAHHAAQLTVEKTPRTARSALSAALACDLSTPGGKLPLVWARGIVKAPRRPDRR